MIFPAKLISFLVGFVSLGAETLWVRTFAFANESTPKSLAIVLGVFLYGIAHGAWRGGKLCETSDRLVEIAALCILGASVSLLATPFLIALLPQGNLVLLLLILTPAILFSVCFPICHHLGTKAATGTVGRSMSRVYASNILGSVLGPLVVNFGILQWATTQVAFTLIGMIGALVGLGLILANSRDVMLRWVAAGATLLGVCAVSTSAIAGNWLIAALSAAQNVEIRRVVETRQGIVVAYKDDIKGDPIFGGNVYDGRANVDPRINSNGINRIIMLPAIVQRPKRVLVIGLSIGSWQHLINGFPGVEHMDVIEINPGYLTMIKDYPAQDRAVNDPRVKLFVGDGRKFLRQNPKAKYDLVVMNTTWHWRAYISMLLSREYLTLVRSHMTDAAVLVYNTTGSPDALKTAATVFPHAYLYDNFAVAGNFDWRKKLAAPEAAAHLMSIQPNGKPLFAESDRDVVTDFLNLARTKDLETVSKAAGRPVEVITDRNLITEYKYGRH
jgi:predicted membrane-bound spermidine synthase